MLPAYIFAGQRTKATPLSPGPRKASPWKGFGACYRPIFRGSAHQGNSRLRTLCLEPRKTRPGKALGRVTGLYFAGQRTKVQLAKPGASENQSWQGLGRVTGLYFAGQRPDAIPGSNAKPGAPENQTWQGLPVTALKRGQRGDRRPGGGVCRGLPR